ncbi:pyrroloquinoline quinone precursor peptide PqqA [Arhodomonas sp. SL1]
MAPLGPWTSPEEEIDMRWSKPAYQELRLGFEINLYITAR